MSCFSNPTNSGPYKTTFLANTESIEVSCCALCIVMALSGLYSVSCSFVRFCIDIGEKNLTVNPNEKSYTWILKYVSCLHLLYGLLKHVEIQTCRDTKCPYVNNIVQGSWIDSTRVGCDRLCGFPDDTAPACFSLYLRKHYCIHRDTKAQFDTDKSINK